MEGAIETVLAGGSDFVAAVAPAVRARTGTEPRLASDARQALALCAQSGGLLVLQYAGPEWLPVVRDLRALCGDAIAVVVAFAPDRAAEVGGAQRAGADEVVPWDGRPEAVQWAVERALAARRGGAPGPAAPGGEAPPALPRTAPVPGRPAAAPVAPLAARAEPPAAAPPPVAVSPAAAPWPAGVLEGPDAEWLLHAALTGASSAPGPQRRVADAVARGLTELERRVLQGGSVPVDAALVRDASVLRLRVALALSAVPEPGAPVNGAAVQALLAELDAALARLKTAAEGAAPDVLAGLEGLRTSLVSEAIDLTEAVQRLTPAGQAPAPAAAPAPQAPAPDSRKAQKPAADFVVPVAGEHVGRNALWTLLVLAILAGAGYHVHRHLTRPQPPSHHYPGAPDDTVASRGGPGQPVVIVKRSGAFDAAEVERLRAQEALRGNAVRQLAPGTLVVERAPPPAAPDAGTPGGTP